MIPVQVKLKYGYENFEVEIPDSSYLGTLSPAEARGVSDPAGEVKRALANPIGSKRLKELVSPGEKVVILVSDITRPAPSYVLLPPVLEELDQAGVSKEDITIVFGLGIHRKQTTEEMERLVGKEVFAQINCIDHEVDNCEKIGVTKRGTVVEVFKKVLAADFLIATGNLEFHYFAGFSGGAKALAPGVCSKETIKQNHQHFLEPGARGGQIEGNPIREEIEEIGEMVGLDFMVNAILNSDKEIVRVVTGDITAAHRDGTGYINNIFRREIKELADIILVTPGGYPKDIDLYQSHKALENASLAVKDGGIIILTAECSDGLGEESFAQALTGGLSPDGLIKELEDNFILGRHKASRIAMINKTNPIFMVTDLSEEIKEKLFVRSFDHTKEALEEAFRILGNDKKVMVIPYGIPTLPNYTGSR